MNKRTRRGRPAHDDVHTPGEWRTPHAFTAVPHMIHKHAEGTEEWMAFFTDPEGRPLAIMSQARK